MNAPVTQTAPPVATLALVEPPSSLVSVLIPAHNEVDNIPALLAKVAAALEGLEARGYAGELVLVESNGETTMAPGDAAAFPAGVANGHHLINRSNRDATFLVVGTRASRERCHYPDIDLMFVADDVGERYTNRSGDAY